MSATDEDESETIEATPDTDEELEVWCFLEESEHEQRQEVISRQQKQKAKKADQSSSLSA